MSVFIYNGHLDSVTTNVPSFCNLINTCHGNVAESCLDNRELLIEKYYEEIFIPPWTPPSWWNDQQQDGPHHMHQQLSTIKHHTLGKIYVTWYILCIPPMLSIKAHRGRPNCIEGTTRNGRNVSTHKRGSRLGIQSLCPVTSIKNINQTMWYIMTQNDSTETTGKSQS